MSDIHLYNTLTRTKELFAPSGPEVLLYTCGPTVYDYVHIGNLRAYIFEDTLRRMLQANELVVNHVMNITDVGHLTDDADAGEDKMEKGAAREGKTAWEIASLYTDAFLEDTERLNLLKPTVLCKATDHIPEQIALIERLEKKGHTYTIGDGVYFDTSTLSDYGKLAQLDIEGLQEGARVEKNAEKRNATDFALWKFSPVDAKRQMEWNSPWGLGFPGWHIECSAMAMHYLGETLDIHCGGVDHIPVHHTNEIAQSEAATGKPFSRFWMHNEFLLVDGGKMSKSKENFYTLQSLIDKGFDPVAYRYFILTSHYRSKLNFTLNALQAAQTGMHRLIAMAADWTTTEHIGTVLTPYYERFMSAVNDDLNTSQALAVVWEMMKSTENAQDKWATLLSVDRVLGLGVKYKVQALQEALSNASENVRALLEERESARATKDFATADRIRDTLNEMGILIEDTNEGQVIHIQQ